MAEPSTRAKWRALRSARVSALKKYLTGDDIVRDGDFTSVSDYFRLAGFFIQPSLGTSLPSDFANVGSIHADFTRLGSNSTGGGSTQWATNSATELARGIDHPSHDP